MFYKIKNYLIYKKNWHILKKELTKISANILPMVSAYSEKKSELIRFVFKLADSTQNIEKEQLLHMVLTIL